MASLVSRPLPAFQWWEWPGDETSAWLHSTLPTGSALHVSCTGEIGNRQLEISLCKLLAFDLVGLTELNSREPLPICSFHWTTVLQSTLIYYSERSEVSTRALIELVWLPVLPRSLSDVQGSFQTLSLHYFL